MRRLETFRYSNSVLALLQIAQYCFINYANWMRDRFKLASGDLMLRSSDAAAPAVLVRATPVVLVVEENLVLRSAFATRLRTAGFEVLEATNSAEAERVLKSTLVDALFLSVRT
jgi:hypothetical protein